MSNGDNKLKGVIDGLVKIAVAVIVGWLIWITGKVNEHESFKIEAQTKWEILGLDGLDSREAGIDKRLSRVEDILPNLRRK